MYTPKRRQQEDKRSRRSGKARQNSNDEEDVIYPEATPGVDFPSRTLSSPLSMTPSESVTSVYIRQQPRRLEPRVSVVTITTVLPPETGVPTNQAGSDSGGEFPIGIVIGASLVGVVIAVAAVVGWICWGKKLKKDKSLPTNKRSKHKVNASNSSTSRLTTNAATMNMHEKHIVSFSATISGTEQKKIGGGGTSLLPRASPSPLSASRPSRGPISSPSPISSPVSYSNSSPSQSSPTNSHHTTPSTEKLLPTESIIPSRGVPGSLGNKYQPNKSSPLAAGAVPYKPAPRERRNEWASGFGTHAHLQTTQPVPSTAQASTLIGISLVNALETPSSGAQETRKSRMSLQSESAMSTGSQYYDDDGGVPIGMAYGGEDLDVDPSPAYQEPPNLPSPGQRYDDGTQEPHQSGATDAYGNMTQGYLAR